MGLFDYWTWNDPAVTTDGSYGSPGYGVLANSSDNPWLDSIVDPNQFSGIPYSLESIDPYSGQSIDLGVVPYEGQQGSNGMTAAGALKSAVGGLGNLLGALGPAFQAAGQLAGDALNRQPTYRPIPTISAPGARTEGGRALPLDLGGQATKVSPLDNYVKLIQGLR